MGMLSLACGLLDVNCYIVWEGGACVVIDPADAQPVLNTLREYGLTCTHILLTHGHFDHIGGVAALQAQTGAAVCIHEGDAGMLHNDADNLAAHMGKDAHITPAYADMPLKGGERIEAGGIKLRVVHTPGHSQGSVCYICEESRTIFTGDTLFRLSVGRADLPGSDESMLYHSIVDTLFALEGDYDVYPGHMRPTRLQFERERNPFIRLLRSQGNH